MPWLLGSHKTPRDKFPTKGEVRALLKAARLVGQDISLAMRLSYYFGLRCGEVRILRGRHIDLTRKTLWAPTLKKVRRKDKRRRLVDPARRPIKDLPTFALSCPDSLDAMATLGLAAQRAPGKDDWVFPSFTEEGLPRPTGWFRNWFGRVRLRAKVRPALSFHCLRHAHGSAVAQGTKDPVFVRDRLRHSSIVTSNIYMHSAQRYEKELGQVLDLGDKA